MRALSAPLLTWITSLLLLLLLLLLPGSAFAMASSFFGAAGSFFAGLVGVFFGAAAALFFSCLILGAMATTTATLAKQPLHNFEIAGSKPHQHSICPGAGHAGKHLTCLRDPTQDMHAVDS